MYVWSALELLKRFNPLSADFINEDLYNYFFACQLHKRGRDIILRCINGLVDLDIKMHLFGYLKLSLKQNQPVVSAVPAFIRGTILI